MKSKLISLFSLFLLLMMFLPVNTTPVQAKPIGNHNISLISHSYDGTYSYWNYRVQSGSPTIDYWMLCWCHCDGTVDVSEAWTCGENSALGLIGIEFTKDYTSGQARTVTITLDDDYPIGFVHMAAVSSDGTVDTGTIPGPLSYVCETPDFMICVCDGTPVTNQTFFDNGVGCHRIGTDCPLECDSGVLEYDFDCTVPGTYTYSLTCCCLCGCDYSEGTITVVEPCVPVAPDFVVCQNEELDEQVFLDNGAGCTGECDVEVTWDFDTSEPGIYPYTVTCTNVCGTQSDTGYVTVEPLCTPIAPDFTICVGTVVNDELFLTSGAGCEDGCEPVLLYDFDGSSPGEYIYTVQCINACGINEDYGTVTVCGLPEPVAPDIVLCTGYTPQQFEDAVYLEGGGCECGSGDCECTVTSIVDNADGTYTVTCTNICGTETATGTITLCDIPQVTAPPVTLCDGYSQQELEDAVYNAGGGCSCGYCDCTDTVITDNGDGTYTLYCENICGFNEAGNIITLCDVPVAAAPDIVLCEGYSPQQLEDAVYLSGGGCECGSGDCDCTDISIVDNEDGTYTVTCTNICGTTDTTGDITLCGIPVVTAPDVVLCEGYTQQQLEDAVLLAGGNCDCGNCECSGYTIIDYGTYYTMCCTNICGTGMDEGAITLCSIPTASAPDIVLCEGYTPAEFEQAVADAGGGCECGSGECACTASSIFDNGDRTYTVTCTNICGTDSANGNITVCDVPVASAPDIVLCEGYTPFQLEQAVENAGGGCECGSGECACTDTTITDNEDGTYTVTCANICGTDSVNGNITVCDMPVASAPDIMLCAGYTWLQFQQAVADAGGGCQCGSGECACTTTSIVDNGNGTYTVSCTNICGTSTTNGNITICDTPVANAPDIVLCEGYSPSEFEQAVADAGGGCECGIGECACTTTSVVDNENGTYTVTCTNICGTTDATGDITVCTTPIASAPNIVLCEGYSPAQFQLAVEFAGGGCQCGECECTETSIVDNQNNTYTVTCTNVCGIDTSTGNITVCSRPVANAPDIVLCDGYTPAEFEQAVADAGGGCQCGDGECACTTTSIFDNGNDTYTVTCTNICGIDSETGNITVCSVPVASAPDIILCEEYTPAEFAQAVADAGGGCECGSGECACTTTSVIDNENGTYTVTCTNMCGTDSETGNITVCDIPVASAPDIVLCVGYTPTEFEQAVADAGGGCECGSGECDCTTTSIVDNLNGTYTVTCTNICGTDSINGNITVCSIPIASAPDIILCYGYTQQQLEDTVADAGGGCECGSGECACTDTSIFDNGNGTYTVTCTNICGAADATGQITLCDYPMPMAPNVVLCEGYTYQDLLDAVASAMGGCECGTGACECTDTSIVDNEDGTYTVTCTNICGTERATGYIVICYLPIVTAPDVTLCEGYTQQELEDAVHQADGGCDCMNCESECCSCLGCECEETITNNGDGTYTVTCTNICGIYSETGTITECSIPTASAPDIVLCEDYTPAEFDQAVADAGGGCECGSGECACTTTSIVDNGNGTYTVTCTNICGTDSETGNITVCDIPVASAPDIVLCVGYTPAEFEQAVADAGGGCECGSGECDCTTTSIVDNQNGTYTVTCTNICGTDSTTGNITVCSTPIASAPDIILCEGYTPAEFEQAVADAGGGCECGNGECACTDTTLTDNEDGTYTVICTNICGTDSTTGNITVCSLPVVTAPEISLCGDYTFEDLENAIYDAGGGCQCGSGECACTDTTITDNEDGSYTITCTNICGTESQDGVLNALPYCEAGAPDFVICQYTEVNDQLFIDKGAFCTEGFDMVLEYDFDGTVQGQFSYSVTCSNQCCCCSDQGTITVTGPCSQGETCEIPLTYLCSGWNLISLPLIPEDSSVESVMNGIEYNLIAMYEADGDPGADDWYYNSPMAPSNLTEMEDGWGYWVSVEYPQTISLYGYEIAPPPPPVVLPPEYRVVPGWNLIGFKSMTEKLASEYLESINGYYSAVYGFDNDQYFIVGTEGHEMLEPGFGYWIAITEEGIIYP